MALARTIAFGGAAIGTALGTFEMVRVVEAGGVTILEGIMTALFAITFAWICFAAASALVGFLLPQPHRVWRFRPEKLKTRTALAVPIYNEDPAKLTAALEVMGQGLVRQGYGDCFEIVILSDSRTASVWVAETQAVDRLRQSLGGQMAVWYRRRWTNHARKAGNIQDFVENWGGRYDHFVVLDADSLMSPDTLVALVGAMEDDPQLGILQTFPKLGGGVSLFARAQQFASRVYGPVIASGYASWQGGEGNFWGHNAILRTEAFASSCILPTLSGKEPFGGPILSHDFVEAALMRRAGWRVEMATDLEGSWEDSPPSLLDAAVRDRRWAQGNLQHLRVIFASGLEWPNRAHLALGVMSYLISPIWLLLIAFGFALALQAEFVRPEYFPQGLQLFPTWPSFDSERMVRLFVVTLGVLFLPKILGLLLALATRSFRQSCGGAKSLLGGALTELLFSALIAPIMMLIHSKQIIEILLGRNSGWNPQRRDGETSWMDAWRAHWLHMVVGIAIACFAFVLSPEILLWLSPTLLGLVLAVPLSRLSSSKAAGRALRRRGLLITPEEEGPPAILRDFHAAWAHAPQAPADAIRALAEDAALREAHFRWVNRAPRTRGKPDAAYLTAASKIDEAATLDEALSWLDESECVQVAGERMLAEKLAGLGRTAAAGQDEIFPHAPLAQASLG
ncbi:hypothetical protein AWJ14_16475 [Hoeflea olei]|uniref:Glucans biosynthesis glucosyltransferase H n=1 Tax=Hoeflea olei TaxID=1480615 RepID=A0A1C1YSN8_9HYPH|nr:hypothetical protein AWJ14_16475 [Hoeflea olei]